MRTLLRKRIRWGLALALAAVLLIPGPAARVAAQPPTSGIVCTTGASFTLTAKSGYVSMPDGNTVFMWSYALGTPASASFQLPGPTLCVNQGDTVTITLNNTLLEPVSIIFPGIDDVRVGGAPVQPMFDITGTLTSLAPTATSGVPVTYSFVASQPGTYIYESGADMGKQVQMGLYGALVVRPTGHSEWAYDSATQFNTATEYVMLFSEVDPFLHKAVERNKAYNVTTYHPRYWLINGRAFPDTIAPNTAAWLPAQPYSALVHIGVNNTGSPALVRYLNVGDLNHPFHPHGNHGRVIARDASPLKTSVGGAPDLSYEKFLVLVGAGQTWDATYTFGDAEGWNPNTNPIPVTVPQPQNLIFKDNATWYSGSPYLGYQDELPAGVVSYNECGEYYHVWHSHALNEAANFDAGFGGMLTLERIDPPLPNTCP